MFMHGGFTLSPNAARRSVEKLCIRNKTKIRISKIKSIQTALNKRLKLKIFAWMSVCCCTKPQNTIPPSPFKESVVDAILLRYRHSLWRQFKGKVPILVIKTYLAFCWPGSGYMKHLKIKGTRSYYFKTIGYCFRTKVKSRLILRRLYATWPWYATRAKISMMIRFSLLLA